jgi:predicted secreted protein
MRQLGLIAVALALMGATCGEPSAGREPPEVAVQATAEPAAAPAPAAPAAPAAPPPSAARIYTDKDATIQAVLGSELRIALPDNVSVPYRWSLASVTPEAALELVEQHYEDKPPAECTDCVGYGGVRVFLLRAKQAGSAELAFAYWPVRDKTGKPEKEHRVVVSVQP